METATRNATERTAATIRPPASGGAGQPGDFARIAEELGLGDQLEPGLLEVGAHELRVDPVEALGWDGDALEAQCFGFLAARVQAALPISFPGTTGVPVALPGGTIAHSGAANGS